MATLPSDTPPSDRADAGAPPVPGGVLGWPAFANRAEQPYNALLYTELRPLGIVVDEATTARVLSGRYSILHLHWPDRRIRARSTFVALARSAALIALLDLAHARGMRIIWTVHNLHAHEGTHRPRLEDAYWRALTRRLDAFITLSGAGIAQVRERFPALRSVPGFVTPHGHMRGVYPDTIDRAAARRALDLEADARVVAFVGQVRAYKNPLRLVQAFRELPHASYRLVIAGRAKPRQLGEALQTAASGDARIRLLPGFLPDTRLQHVLRAADLVALPYRDIFNSGSALLALSFDRPVLVPALGAMPELAAVFGEEWVRTYDGELTARTLGDALEWAAHGERAPRPPMDELGWDRIARLTAEAYAAVLRPPRASHEGQ